MALIKVIQNKGKKEELAWKYPDDELNTLTQLVVNESEEAILYKNGEALDVFGSGRYTLDTPNIPILNAIINLPFGLESPFKAQVWFVNKLHLLDIKWGTKAPLLLQDPKYKVIVPLGIYGQFGIKISNSKKFLVKLVGRTKSFTIDDIKDYFKGLYLTKVKDSVSSYLVKKNVSVLELNAYIDEISTYLKDDMESIFDDYGIELVNFYINEASVIESDSSVIRLREALAKKAEMDIIGYSYEQERSFNTMDSIAKNEGMSSTFLNAGLGIGAGIGVAKNIANNINEISSNLSSKKTKYCMHCGNELPGVDCKFCPECGGKL